jgi:hypothetical protein
MLASQGWNGVDRFMQSSTFSRHHHVTLARPRVAALLVPSLRHSGLRDCGGEQRLKVPLRESGGVALVHGDHIQFGKPVGLDGATRVPARWR